MSCTVTDSDAVKGRLGERVGTGHPPSLPPLTNRAHRA